MKFKLVEQDCLDQFKMLIKTNNYNSSVYTLGVLYIWKDYFNLQYTSIDNCLLFKGTDIDGNEIFFYPLGKNDASCLKYIPTSSNIIYIPEEKINHNAMLNVHEMKDDFDYVYSYHELLSLTGKHKSSVRNHINRFKKEYPLFTYEKITENNISDAINLLNVLVFNNEYKNLEKSYNLKALESFFILNFIGYILYVNQEAIAFSIGEIINDTLYVQFEKNLHHFNGSGDMNRYLFLEHLKNYNISFVNREEDTGDLGLRTSKMRLGPIKFIRKYQAIKK